MSKFRVMIMNHTEEISRYGQYAFAVLVIIQMKVVIKSNFYLLKTFIKC